AHDAIESDGRLARWRRRTIGQRESSAPIAAAEREVAYDRRRIDPRQRLKCGEETGARVDPLGIIRIKGLWQGESNRETSTGVESGADVTEVKEAFHEQAGTGEEHEGQGK